MPINKTDIYRRPPLLNPNKYKKIAIIANYWGPKTYDIDSISISHKYLIFFVLYFNYLLSRALIPTLLFRNVKEGKINIYTL